MTYPTLTEGMAYLVKMPKLSMGMEVGEVLCWYMEEGDRLEEGDIVVEVESEKAVSAIEAREDGVLRRIFFGAGEEMTPGTAMGVVAGADEPIEDLLDEAAATGADTKAASTDEGADVTATSEDTDAPSTGAGSGGERSTGESLASAGNASEDGDGNGVTGDPRATPRARRLARERGVDVAAVDGTGPKGAITAGDVQRAGGAASTDGRTAGTGETWATTRESHTRERTVEEGAKSVSAGTTGESDDRRRNDASPNARRLAAERGVDLTIVEGTGPEGAVVGVDVKQLAAGGGARPATRTVVEERELTGMRRTIAERLGDSYRNAVHVTENRNVDADELVHAVRTASEALAVEVSVEDVLLVAVSEALAEHPAFNASFEEGVHRLHAEHNLGVAVDVERGLVAPVLGDVREASIGEVARRRHNLVERTSAGDYSMDDLTGGTFTVTNLGVLGVDSFTPVIDPPQVAILALGRIREEPVRGEDGGVEFVERLTLSLSFDHRVVDGADGARFLASLTERIENADRLLVTRGT
jgi:pyruvate dehydrogenase E2 component (dihydrolipoamide acetyltransferase)